MKNCVLACLIFVSLHATATDLYPGNEAIDIKHYRFELELNDTTDIIAGRATVTVAFRKLVNSFELDLTGVSNGKGMTVGKVLQGQTAISFTHVNNKINIQLTNTPSIGAEMAFTIEYTGIPQNGLIIGKNKYNERTFFGDNWPDRAHHWLPTIDHPSDKAAVDFIVIAPSIYEVIGNGVKIEESYINAQQKLTHWREGVDIPTKVMVIGAARFAIRLEGDVQGIPVESWVYPQNRLEGFHDYAVALNVLEYFHNHIGPYPYKKLANVQSKTVYGGMENASNIFYFENSVNGKADQEDLIAHEIAHQWFGNSASEIDWHHIWLSEGFATYFSHLYGESVHGKEDLESAMQTARVRILEFFKTKPLPIVFSELPKNLLEILSVNSYQKGGWVLHMLRNEVGDDAFWLGARNYYRTFQNKNAQTSDFQKIMEEASGKDLDVFFNQWLFRPGHPVLEGFWVYNPKAKSLDITVNQIQKSQPFEFTLEVGIYSGNTASPQIEKLKFDKAAHKFSLPIGAKPAKIELDPNTRLLFEGKIGQK